MYENMNSGYYLPWLDSIMISDKNPPFLVEFSCHYYEYRRILCQPQQRVVLLSAASVKLPCNLGT